MRVPSQVLAPPSLGRTRYAALMLGALAAAITAIVYLGTHGGLKTHQPALAAVLALLLIARLVLATMRWRSIGSQRPGPVALVLTALLILISCLAPYSASALAWLAVLAVESALPAGIQTRDRPT